MIELDNCPEILIEDLIVDLKRHTYLKKKFYESYYMCPIAQKFLSATKEKSGRMC